VICGEYLAKVYEIRLRQTGRNHGGKDDFVVSSFEIFGSVVRTMRWREFPRELANGHAFLTTITPVGRFPPSVKKSKKFEVEFDVPDRIIVHHSRMAKTSALIHHSQKVRAR
jgi:hypothetical protein